MQLCGKLYLGKTSRFDLVLFPPLPKMKWLLNWGLEFPAVFRNPSNWISNRVAGNKLSDSLLFLAICYSCNYELTRLTRLWFFVWTWKDRNLNFSFFLLIKSSNIIVLWLFGGLHETFWEELLISTCPQQIDTNSRVKIVGSILHISKSLQYKKGTLFTVWTERQYT